MSRIDDAIKRAQDAPAGEKPVPTVDPATDDTWIVPDDAASSDVPWDLGSAAISQPSAFGMGPRPMTTAAAAQAADPAPTVRTGAVLDYVGFERPLSEKIVASGDMSQMAVEQYRKLAATLHHAQVDRGIKLVVIASANMGEGKTLTSTNLALTLSESYKRRVLLIDADLRRPSLHEVFQLPNVSGLNDGLYGGNDRKLSLLQVSAQLTVLPAGMPTPDPMSGLTSNRMRRILDEARERFDWVIIDTPPVGLLPDANLLAAMVDVALLVVSAGRTPYVAVQKAVAALGRDKVMGVVLNGVDGDALAHAASAYGYGYGHGYGAYGYGQRSRKK